MGKTDFEIALEAKVKKGQKVFIAHNATVLGNVQLGDDVSIWYQAVLRGDSDAIIIGDRTNIQDGAIIHVDPGDPVNIGNDVIVGHGAIIHGATVDDNTLVGMRSTILNNARVGKFCVIGAHALVTAGTEIPDYSLVLGSPAKIIRKLNDEEIKKVKLNAVVYVKKKNEYLGLD